MPYLLLGLFLFDTLVYFESWFTQARTEVGVEISSVILRIIEVRIKARIKVVFTLL